MMLTPLSLSALGSAPTVVTASTPVTPSPASMFEGLPIYLVPTGTAAQSLSLLPKIIQGARANSGTEAKVDTSKHFHIFVGDLSAEIDNKGLKDAFSKYGEVSEAKVIRDSQTLRSKGYGFVSFVRKEDATKAIEEMNGQWIGRRIVRTNWAARKPNAATTQKQGQTFEEVYLQAGSTNSTVYVGGTSPTTTEQQLKELFAKFGTVVETRIFKQQGYCFVRLDTKEAAAQAICQLNGVEFGGSVIKCSWGKEEPKKSPSLTNLAALAQLAAPLQTTLPYCNYVYASTTPTALYHPYLSQNWQQQALASSAFSQALNMFPLAASGQH